MRGSVADSVERVPDSLRGSDALAGSEAGPLGYLAVPVGPHI